MLFKRLKVTSVIAAYFFVLAFSYIGTGQYAGTVAAGETNDNLPAGFETPSAVVEPTAAKKLKLLVSADRLEIFNNIRQGKEVLITTFQKRSWGVWNIGYWASYNVEATPANRYKLLAGTGSDWEYVFQVARNAADPTIFSGGNHGNEKLESFKLIDLDDSAVLDAGERASYEMDALGVVEQTSLYSDDTYSYKYADVKRTYKFMGDSISLQTVINFTADIYAGMSYVAMLPMSKAIGPTITFGESGRSYTVGESPVGADGPFRDSYGFEKSRSVLIHGKTPYSVRVTIGNDEMVDNFKNKCKVFYWDVNSYGNKLYFSKYDDDAPRLIRAGETQLLQTQWDLLVADD